MNVYTAEEDIKADRIASAWYSHIIFCYNFCF